MDGRSLFMNFHTNVTGAMGTVLESLMIPAPRGHVGEEQTILTYHPGFESMDQRCRESDL